MNTPKELLSYITEINYDLLELKQLLAESTNHCVQYLKPLTLGHNSDEDGKRSIELTSNDFAPSLMEWPSCLENVYSHIVPSNRVPSSLPRTLGHIVVAKQNREKVWHLVQKVNQVKALFNKQSSVFYKEHVTNKIITHSDFLRTQNVFNNDEHYEMVIKPIMTSRHVYAKSQKLDVSEIDFEVLSQEDQFELSGLTLKWLPSNYTTVFKGSYAKAIETEEVINKMDVYQSIELHHQKFPSATYIKRYYIPPAPIAHFRFNKHWLNSKITVNYPILVFDCTEDATIQTRLDPISVTLHRGAVRATKSLEKIQNKVLELVPGSNWYALR
ncbi:hypothetical protein [Marinomonas fungiae]|uniref:Uncharacterized protein n=1 Tax=Marinomonas fungiae TaxID=1137284 RepID=A0A0K6IVC7_9GAMM|nr:hypothetical protein [Marinomonas fungiae]CUB07043.1 hypothetical protein Ga0061065_1313 [Marinomonas fungiae]